MESVADGGPFGYPLNAWRNACGEHPDASKMLCAVQTVDVRSGSFDTDAAATHVSRGSRLGASRYTLTSFVYTS
jgi:hypothetical protein